MKYAERVHYWPYFWLSRFPRAPSGPSNRITIFQVTNIAGICRSRNWQTTLGTLTSFPISPRDRVNLMTLLEVKNIAGTCRSQNWQTTFGKLTSFPIAPRDRVNMITLWEVKNIAGTCRSRNWQTTLSSLTSFPIAPPGPSQHDNNIRSEQYCRYLSVPELANNHKLANNTFYSPPQTSSIGLLYRKWTILPGTHRDLSVPELANKLWQAHKFA